MVIHKESRLEQEVEKLASQIKQLKNSNSHLLDEIATLKSNYGRLVEDVGDRFKVVHEKIFR